MDHISFWKILCCERSVCFLLELWLNLIVVHLWFSSGFYPVTKAFALWLLYRITNVLCADLRFLSPKFSSATKWFQIIVPMICDWVGMASQFEMCCIIVINIVIDLSGKKTEWTKVWYQFVVCSPSIKSDQTTSTQVLHSRQGNLESPVWPLTEALPWW